MTIWVKVDADFWRNPKVRKAGLDGGALFLELLAINRRGSRDGVLSSLESDLDQLIALLAGVMSAERVHAALGACERAGLVTVQEGETLRICGWDDTWRPAPKSTERVQRFRVKRRETREPKEVKRAGGAG